MIRRALLRLIARPDTGELRPWALVLFAWRRRARAWWYRRGLPRLIRVRALARDWCRRSPPGRLLCRVLPRLALAVLGALALPAVGLALLLAWVAWGRWHCLADPCAWECRRLALADPLIAAARARCPWPPLSREE